MSQIRRQLRALNNLHQSHQKIRSIKSKKVRSCSARPPAAVWQTPTVFISTPESAENNVSSDDEPLSELAKKLYPQRKRKATVFLSAQKPVKSKRKSAKKAGGCQLTLMDSWEVSLIATLWVSGWQCWMSGFNSWVGLGTFLFPKNVSLAGLETLNCP